MSSRVRRPKKKSDKATGQVATEFRLLRLIPGSGSDTIACEDVVVSFVDTKRPSYYALSYVWGDPKDTKPIMFNGSPFWITQNLWRALRQLRADKTVSKTLIWIDSICINQNDLQERNHQVSAMGQLYSSAAEVIVWLGEGSDQSYYFMDFLCRFEELGHTRK
ncbi:hypothetical protein BU16DRAFT_458540 [Lophium mytilinum]|uniref:Heterokaryon incompatibility domain-containing protein n=1 Tax=Lophium mytilinum TaxID=390894 RepID=A0A6A6QWE2_9PEZI|nr:hypothetical protein BU16DRAFT_458540 [Lophium mytilinum]